MNTLRTHIIDTTGADNASEPTASIGDWAVFVFCLGVFLGWLIGGSA